MRALPLVANKLIKQKPTNKQQTDKQTSKPTQQNISVFRRHLQNIGHRSVPCPEAYNQTSKQTTTKNKTKSKTKGGRATNRPTKQPEAGAAVSNKQSTQNKQAN